MVLNIGEVVPEFELETSEGDMFRLSDLEGQWKVVFFFAKSGSPTCKRGCLSFKEQYELCLLYTSPSPRDRQKSRMPSSA